MKVELTLEEIELLTHALDSHVDWMKEDADDTDEDYAEWDIYEDITAARALEDRLVDILVEAGK